VVTFGRPLVQNGAVKYRQGKTGKWITTPLAKPILDEVAQLPAGQSHWLLTEYGKAFTANGFGGWFRDRCDEAGVDKSAHGLRKAGATQAANAGATANQIKAFGGWSTLAEAERYTRSANEGKMSGDVVQMLERKRNEKLPPTD
jgi:integrase